MMAAILRGGGPGRQLPEFRRDGRPLILSRAEQNLGVVFQCPVLELNVLGRRRDAERRHG